MKRITQKKFESDRINQVKDMFLFSCYTGLSYVDLQQLKINDVCEGADGEKWIFTKRQKTKTATHIPLLQEAVRLMEKYHDHPKCIVSNLAFPVLTNQKMNSYLKEIADCCGIKINLTFHIARHTFATTITLSNGVPIESVSKMLGHSNLIQTQHYAKTLDIKVGQDMGKLRNLLSEKRANIIFIKCISSVSAINECGLFLFSSALFFHFWLMATVKLMTCLSPLTALIVAFAVSLL
ncbi:site-specific integrase [Mucilaginibacter antarcticus]|uniref:site-specific integrase n=1 Tax=Mucilaginibacter antarcticus TaxID=1855725 RepID=UPI00364374E6